MIKNIGIDLISIARFKKINFKDYSRWNKYFSKQEWQYAFNDNHSAEHLAGIFAAKEAAMKAYGVAGVAQFQNWEVKKNKSGQPQIFFKGKNKKIKTLISISHEKNLAIAVVVLL